MNDSSLPPTPKSNSLGLSAAIALVVLGGVGFGAWRWLTPGSTAPAPAAATLSVVSASPQQLAPAAPPPPPPPPPPAPADPSATASAPSASVAAKGPGAKSLGPGPSGPKDSCSGPCNGAADASFNSALRQRAGQARSCYDRSLRQNEHLSGKLLVALRISPEGKACDVSIASDTMGSATVNACILKNFSSGSYPPPRGGCVNAQVPLNFVSQQ
jgi:hypothetical protein